MKNPLKIILTLVIAFVFLQSLPFKFTNSLETQHIFGTLAEWSGFTWFGQYGGYLIGAAELVAALILLIPLALLLLQKNLSAEKRAQLNKLHCLGALMAVGIMSGAIFFHLFTPLGIVMPHFDATTGLQIGDDGGILFTMACITWVSALVLIVLHWKQEDSLIPQAESV